MDNGKYLGRVIFLLIYVVSLWFLFQYLGHSILQNNPLDVLIFSTLVALAINSLLMSCFFETPKDVIASSLNILILISSLYVLDSFPQTLFNILLIYALICLFLSTTSVMFYSPEEAPDCLKQRTSLFLKKLSICLGESKIIFSFLIIVVLISMYSSQEMFFYSLVLSFLIILVSDVIRDFILASIVFICSFFKRKQNQLSSPIGHIVAVQSKDTFVIDLIDINKRPSLNIFDLVEFRYGADDIYIKGIVIDRYYLDTKQKIKVLKVSQKKHSGADQHTKYQDNLVYKITNPSQSDKEFLDKFVGTVIEESDTSKMLFEYSSKKLLSNGDLLSVDAKNKEGKSVSVLYQIVQAKTAIKSLENRNEIGLIKAQAMQLGVWQEDYRNFESYGWVHPINTPVKIATDVKGTTCLSGEIRLGSIENTQFDVIARMDDLITHHTAILGATGTGKSVFTRNLIRELAEAGNKIFCIDFTGEAQRFLETNKLVDNAALKIKSVGTLSGFSDTIGWILDQQKEFANKRDKQYNQVICEVENYIKSELQAFIDTPNSNIGLFELPELSNTEETLEYTKFFFKALFDLAKNGAFQTNRACIFMDEAHTLIPEWNSVGGADDKTARRLTNTIAQIALQGRKYNVGLLLVAQRTANVSKTILTQCNTVISFKQFDNTSRDFLINHFGPSFIEVLPELKVRCAIVSGKALISDVPIIFKVPEISEEPIKEIPQEKINEPQEKIQKEEMHQVTMANSVFDVF